jgi:hypothetical protein
MKLIVMQFPGVLNKREGKSNFHQAQFHSQHDKTN